jgi:carboxyl-terminal processing protease
VKHLRLNIREARWSRRVRYTLLIVLLLALAGGLSLPGGATPYDSLRLYTEALYEISQKYVHPQSQEKVIYGSLRGMMNSLDPDSSFLTPQEYKKYQEHKPGQEAEAGLELIYKDGLLTAVSVLDNGPAAAAGLKPGDHIIKINGKSVRNLTTQEAAWRFRGPTGTKIKLQMIRNGALKPQDVTVILGPVGTDTVSSQVLGGDYGYVRVSFFNNDTPRELATVLQSLLKRQPPIRGLILDLRNNARGSLEQAVRTASLFLGDKKIVSARGRSRDSEEVFKGKARDLILKKPLPIVVLVDQGSARGAEILAGALHDEYPARLLGAKTLGLCGLTRVMPLDDGSALVMTVAQCYTPDDQKIQGKGLKPDIEGKTPELDNDAAVVKPGQPANPGKDPWVLQALEFLKSGKKALVARKMAK